MDVERIYRALPIPLQHVACSAEGLRVERRRYNDEFRSLLSQAEARAGWSQEELERYRDRRLLEFVAYALANVPYYRRRLAEAGIRADEITSVEDYARLLPVVTKTDAQEHGPELRSPTVAKGDYFLEHTSGTTGGGLRFATTWSAWREQWAIWWRYRRWHGIDLGTWCGYFAGRVVVPLEQRKPPFWRYNFPGKQIVFSGYHISDANLPHYVDELRRRRPPWIHGYPSLVALVASYLTDRKTDIGYELRFVTTGAENLLPQQRDAIERGLGVRPKQHYGMAEAVVNASECEARNLHLDEDFAFTEFVDDPATGMTACVGTNFANRATPLLRYHSGDVASPSPERCTCGRPGRLIERIDGRKEDALTLPDGSRVFTLNHVFKDLVNVREAQIYQPKVGEVVIRVVPSSEYGESDANRLLHEATTRLTPETKISLEYWRELPRTKTGKLRLVVSDVPLG